MNTKSLRQSLKERTDDLLRHIENIHIHVSSAVTNEVNWNEHNINNSVYEVIEVQMFMKINGPLLTASGKGSLPCEPDEWTIVDNEDTVKAVLV